MFVVIAKFYIGTLFAVSAVYILLNIIYATLESFEKRRNKLISTRNAQAFQDRLFELMTEKAEKMELHDLVSNINRMGNKNDNV